MKKIIQLSMIMIIGLVVVSGCKTTGDVTGKDADGKPGTKATITGGEKEPGHAAQAGENKRILGNKIKKNSSDNDHGISKKNESDLSFSFSGDYRITIRGFTGILALKKIGAGYEGTIYYRDWGKGVPMPLHNLKINDNKIYFERSVRSREELKKYGGSRYFTQKYTGLFSKDGKMIRGTFVDSGAEANWHAEKK